MNVDVSTFGRAIERLAEALPAFDAEPGNELFRNALVKRFEFSYELSQITLRRFLEAYSVHWKVSGLRTIPDVVRTANQDGLLQGDWKVWSVFRDARNVGPSHLR